MAFDLKWTTALAAALLAGGCKRNNADDGWAAGTDTANCNDEAGKRLPDDFYTMFNLAPVGRYHVQVCGTTPCMLRGSDDVLAACKNKGLIKGKTTPDGLFTLTEVECMGNCASAPMVQINDDNFEDLDYDRTVTIREARAGGESPKTGTQEPGRHTVEPLGGPTTLTAMVGDNHDYRGEWGA